MAGQTQSNGADSEKRLRATLMIAHPGHELRVHGWLEMAQPEVWVLTDGSGRGQHSRIDSTTRVLANVGGHPGSVYGRMRDVDLYSAVLSFDHGRFTDLVDQLAETLIERQVEFIAGDAEEGYNPAHDVCRLVINAAVALVKRKTEKQIANYDFPLMGPPGRGPDALLDDSLWFNLDDMAFARKIAAARNYPELHAEVEAALNVRGQEVFPEQDVLVQRVRSTFGVTNANSFRVECLRPVHANIASTRLITGPKPYYEEYGEQQVRAGHYSQVLRYHDHMLPLAAALNSHVERTSGRT